MSENKQIHFPAVLFGLSLWMLFFAGAGEAMMQTVIPLVVCLMFYIVFKKRGRISIDKHSIPLLVCLCSCILATIGGCITYSQYADWSRLFDVLYVLTIIFWYVALCSEQFTRDEFSFIKKSYILFGVMSSIQVIYLFCRGAEGKVSLVSVFGETINPNHFAAILSLLTVSIATDLFFGNNSKKDRIFELISFCIILSGMALVGSRAAFIGTSIGCLFVFLRFAYTRKKLSGIIISCIIGLILLGIYLNLDRILPEWFYQRYFVNAYNDESNAIRISYWNNAIKCTFRRPLLGYGFGLLDKIPECKSVLDGVPIPASAPAHNTYLDVLVYGGVIGFISFSIYFCACIFTLVKKRGELLPLVIDFLFLTIIVGADRSIYFWAIMILFLQITRKGEADG